MFSFIQIFYQAIVSNRAAGYQFFGRAVCSESKQGGVWMVVWRHSGTCSAKDGEFNCLSSITFRMFWSTEVFVDLFLSLMRRGILTRTGAAFFQGDLDSYAPEPLRICEGMSTTELCESSVAVVRSQVTSSKIIGPAYCVFAGNFDSDQGRCSWRSRQSFAPGCLCSLWSLAFGRSIWLVSP